MQRRKKVSYQLAIVSCLGLCTSKILHFKTLKWLSLLVLSLRTTDLKGSGDGGDANGIVGRKVNSKDWRMIPNSGLKERLRC